MKITIYELLGLIKDGKAPKYIIFDTDRYSLNPNYHYVRELGDEIIRLDIQYNLVNCLNEEVEIIEDNIMGVEQDKKIDELVKSIECVEDINFLLGKLEYHYEQTKDEICEKINELVKAYNSLKEDK